MCHPVLQQLCAVITPFRSNSILSGEHDDNNRSAASFIIFSAAFSDFILRFFNTFEYDLLWIGGGKSMVPQNLARPLPNEMEA